MHSSPWPGDCKLILPSCRDNTLEDFQDGCSERIRVGKNHAFGPPQRYQIPADTSPTTPRALEQITRGERGGRRTNCVFVDVDVWDRNVFSCQ